MTENSNPKITSLLFFFAVVEAIVLALAGVGLFFIPEAAKAFWPWALLPFNARFLGAVYSAALVAAAMQVYYGRWSPSRVVNPMIFAFTAVMIVLSFLHINEFDFSSVEVWVWFVLYVIVPVNAAYHLWMYRHLPPADSTSLSAGTQKFLLAESIILGLYGLALLILPSFAKTLWSWGIDDFHAQMYSVTFITPAIGAFMLSKGASKTEWLTMGLTQAILGLFPIIALIVVDATVKSVNWASASTWLWLTLFATIFLISIWMIKESQMSLEKTKS